MDNNKSNKDSIKEMLEGHKKKVNLITVIVGVIVVLFVGIGAVYVISALNSPPKNYTEENLNKYTENANPQKADNTEANQQTKDNNGSDNDNNMGSQDHLAVNNAQGNHAKTYEIPSNNETINNNESKNTSEPQIINPYIPKTVKKNITHNVSKPAIHKKHTVKAVIAKKHTKKIHHNYKKHKLIYKKYVMQVSSNLDRRYASITVAKLKKCGHKVYIRAKIINNKIYTRVMVGPDNGYSAAKEEALLIQRQLKLKYMPIIKKYAKVP